MILARKLHLYSGNFLSFLELMNFLYMRDTLWKNMYIFQLVLCSNKNILLKLLILKFQNILANHAFFYTLDFTMYKAEIHFSCLNTIIKIFTVISWAWAHQLYLSLPKSWSKILNNWCWIDICIWKGRQPCINMKTILNTLITPLLFMCLARTRKREDIE